MTSSSSTYVATKKFPKVNLIRRYRTNHIIKFEVSTKATYPMAQTRNGSCSAIIATIQSAHTFELEIIGRERIIITYIVVTGFESLTFFFGISSHQLTTFFGSELNIDSEHCEYINRILLMVLGMFRGPLRYAESKCSPCQSQVNPSILEEERYKHELRVKLERDLRLASI